MEQILASTTLQKNYHPTFKDKDGNKVRCESCGRVLQEVDQEPFCMYCDMIMAEDMKLAEATEKAFKNMQFTKQMDKFQKNSLINEKLKNVNFDNYKPRSTEQGKALQKCKDYGDGFSLDDPKNLFLFGPYGTGKSHLAKSVTDVVMAKDFTCLFVSFPKLLTKIKSTWRKDSDISEFDLLEMLVKVDLLVLDDLGAERNSVNEADANWAKPKFFEIVDGRVGKHTVLTTNFDMGQTMRVYGERDFSRFLEHVVLVEVPGSNYRMRNFEKR